MSQYDNLKATIALNVYENHRNEVTANMVKAAMNAMVDSLGAGYQYLGIATPTSPGTAQTPDQKVFYIATTPGTYTYLGGLVVNDGEVAVLKWDTAWHKEVTGAATAAQVTELGQKTYRFNVFNKDELLDCVKEFYVSNSNIDLSTVICGRLHYGSSHGYGIELCSSTDFFQVVLELRGNLTSSIIKSSDNSAYAIIDWDKVSYYCNGADVLPIFNLSVDNVIPKIKSFWPYLKSLSLEGHISTIENSISTIENNTIPAIKKSKSFLTDSDLVNPLIKELYISGQSIDYSTVYWIRFYFGYSNLWGVEFFTKAYSTIVRMAISSSTQPSSLIIGSNGGAVIDWDLLLKTSPGRNYVDLPNISISEDVLIKDIDFSPTVKQKVEKEQLLFRIGEWDMNISNSAIINGCVKELHYDDKEVDLSQYTILRFYFGSSKEYGIQIYKQGYADSIIMRKNVQYVDLNSSFLQGTTTNGHNWYVVLNWDKIQEVCGSALYKDFMNVVLNPYIIKSSCYWPAIYSEIVGNKDADYQHTIDVYPDQEKPCQIANLIRSITDASATNRYKILVHDGEYQETDIVTKDYIDLVGEHYENVVLIHDGDATYNSPADYSMGQEYSNVPVNTIPWKDKHLIYHMSNSTVKNLTLKTVGGICKYICHQDSSNNKFTAIFENVCFLNGSGSQVLGVGARAGQYFKYLGCNFIQNENENLDEVSFNLHNWGNQNGTCGLHFENCSFTHVGWIHVLDLGSGQTDNFDFINCICDDPVNTFIRFVGSSPDVSYSIILKSIGGNLGGAVPDGSRPNTKLSIQSEYVKLIYSTNNIPFGTPLYNNAPAPNANNGYVFKLSDIDNIYNMKTVNSFDVGFGLAEAGNYAHGDNVYINNGKFTKTPNGNIAGTVKQAIELSEDGYVMIQKTKTPN